MLKFWKYFWEAFFLGFFEEHKVQCTTFIWNSLFVCVCNVIIFITVNFDQFNASLLNKRKKNCHFFTKSYSPQTFEWYPGFHKNIKQHFSCYIKCILEWFLKDHVTLQTRVMMLQIQFSIT